VQQRAVDYRAGLGLRCGLTGEEQVGQPQGDELGTPISRPKSSARTIPWRREPPVFKHFSLSHVRADDLGSRNSGSSMALVFAVGRPFSSMSSTWPDVLICRIQPSGIVILRVLHQSVGHFK